MKADTEKEIDALNQAMKKAIEMAVARHQAHAERRYQQLLELTAAAKARDATPALAVKQNKPQAGYRASSRTRP